MVRAEECGTEDLQQTPRVSVVSVFSGDVQSCGRGEDPADESESRRGQAFAAWTCAMFWPWTSSAMRCRSSELHP